MFTELEIINNLLTKSDLFKNEPEPFDMALPQVWLDSFCERHNINNVLVVCTTVWSYSGSLIRGEPVTKCKEVQRCIEKDNNA